MIYITFNVFLSNYRFKEINAVAFVNRDLTTKKYQRTYHTLQLVQLLSSSVQRNSSPCSNAINNQFSSTKEMHQYECSKATVQPNNDLPL